MVHYPGKHGFAPDFFVVFDVENRPRDTWFVSREGRGLDIAFEVVWKGDTKKDYGRNVRRFDLVISDAVLEEAARGNSEAAQRRLDALQGIRKVDVDAEVERLAARLLLEGGLPPGAAYDALHVALAAVHGVEFLLTWNCRHIDNAERKPLVRAICEKSGYSCPEICTPNELLGDGNA